MRELTHYSFIIQIALAATGLIVLSNRHEITHAWNINLAVVTITGIGLVVQFGLKRYVRSGWRLRRGRTHASADN